MAAKDVKKEVQDVPATRSSTPPPIPSARPSTNTGKEGPVEFIEVGFVPSPNVPQVPSTPSVDNLTMVRDLIDCLQRPPSDFSINYVMSVQRTCSLLKHPAAKTILETLNKQITKGTNFEWAQQLFPEQSASSVSSKNSRAPVVKATDASSQELFRNVVNMGRNAMFEVIKRINEFVSKAKNAGFVPQNNPFVKAASFNIGRYAFTPIQIHQDDANEILRYIQIYLALKEADEKKEIKFDKDLQKSVQLSSATFSLKGLGGSGDSLLDLAKLLPNGEEILRQKADEALAVFDFTKRTPKIVFTSHYSPFGAPRGIIVGWRKIPDASGYVIKRKNIFTGDEVTYTIDNKEARKQTQTLSEYVKTWILSFYDSLPIDAVTTFLDSDVRTEAYYVYRIQAYQSQNDTPGKMFTVPVTPRVFNNLEKVTLRSYIESIDPSTGPDNVSPYPFLSVMIFGDPKFDWLLACINIRESISRGDPKSVTRNYSYLAAQLDFLTDQAAANKFVIPKDNDVSMVLKNMQDSISTFGISQVMNEILQESGVLYYFDGKDPADNSLFTDVPRQKNDLKGLVPTVLSAVDPETLILNLNVLSTNIKHMVTGAVSALGNMEKGVTPTEIEMNPNFDDPTAYLANDGLKFKQDLNISDDSIDITTPLGMGLLLRTIRALSENLSKPPDVPRPQRTIPVEEMKDPVMPRVRGVKEPKSPEPATDENGNEIVVESSDTSVRKKR